MVSEGDNIFLEYLVYLGILVIVSMNIIVVIYIFSDVSWLWKFIFFKNLLYNILEVLIFLIGRV